MVKFVRVEPSPDFDSLCAIVLDLEETVSDLKAKQAQLEKIFCELRERVEVLESTLPDNGLQINLRNNRVAKQGA